MTGLTLTNQADALAKRVLPQIRRMIVAEAECLREQTPPIADREIMAAAGNVARSVDLLAQTRYSAGEAAARVKVERAAAHLGKVMRRHGRMP